MSFKGVVRELKEMKDGIRNLSWRGIDSKIWCTRSRSHVAPDQAATPSVSVEQGLWANLPTELLIDILRRVEASETSWPARIAVVYCASVCKSWREVTKEIVETPQQCGMLTFPISLKQPGPRDLPIQCFITRDRGTSTFRLFFGQSPSEDESDKLLLAARKTRRATIAVFDISLVANDFSRNSNTNVGKLRSNFIGTKFTIYDSQPLASAAVKQDSTRSCRRCDYCISTISYELNVLRTRGPRRLTSVMHSIPVTAIQEGGTAPTPQSLSNSSDNRKLGSQRKDPVVTSIVPEEPLVLKNKAPRWHDQLQCWCLNFRGRVTVASVKNFQLVAAVDQRHNVREADHEKVILQFGKIGKDIFTMDYRYPLSAFQAFAICLSSFDTKPACE